MSRIYKTPKDMFKHKADKHKKEGDRHWAIAKTSEKKGHFEYAKNSYEKAIF